MRKKYNIKGTIIVIIFAMYANVKLFAVDTAPRISDKEIVQNLADIKSEFKVGYKEIANLRNEMKSEFKAVYAKIDGNKKELQAQMEGNKKELQAQMEGNKKELQAQMEGNKKELQVQINGVRDELTGKFNLMIGILLTMLTGIFGVLGSFIFTQLKIFAPMKIKYESFKEDLEKEKEKLKNVILVFKEIAQNDKKVRNTLQNLHLL